MEARANRGVPEAQAPQQEADLGLPKSWWPWSFCRVQ